MFKMSCPRDKAPLERRRSGAFVSFVCPTCQGSAITFAVIRNVAQEGLGARIWSAAKRPEAPEGAACPSCAQATRLASVTDAQGAPLEVDVCLRCALLWLDAGEPAQLEGPGASPRPAAPPPAVAATRPAVVIKAPADGEPGEAALADRIAVQLGLRAEQVIGREGLTPLAVAVTGTIGMSIAYGLLRWTLLEERFGLIPARAFRPAELHRWLSHVSTPSEEGIDVCTMAAFLFAASDLERRWGPWRLGAALTLGVLSGAALHVGVDAAPQDPVGGPAALLSVALVLLSLERPDAVFLQAGRDYDPDVYAGSFVEAWQRAFVLRIPVRRALFIWLLILAVLVGMRLHAPPLIYITPWLGLGGALGGLLAWFTLRPPPARRRASR